MASEPQPPSWHGVWCLISPLFLPKPRFSKTYSCANLDVVFSDWVAVVHCVEGCHLVDSHWWHLKDTRNLVHDTQTGEAGLALAKIEQRHNSCLLVLWWIAGKDLLDNLLILLAELEWDGGVVLSGVAVLDSLLAAHSLSMFEELQLQFHWRSGELAVTYHHERVALSSGCSCERSALGADRWAGGRA